MAHAKLLPLSSLSISESPKSVAREVYFLDPFNTYHDLEYYLGLEMDELPLCREENVEHLQGDMKRLFERMRWAIVPTLKTLQTIIDFQLQNSAKPLHRRQKYTEVFPLQEYEYLFVPLDMKRAPVYIHRPNKPSARYDYPYDHLPHFKSRVHPIYVTAYLYRTLKCLRHSTLEMSHRLSQHMSMMRSLKCVWNDRPLLDFVDEEWRGPHRLVFLDGLEPTFFDDFPCCKDLEGFTIDDIDLDADFDDDHSDIYDLESAKTQTGSFSPPSPARYPTRHEAWRLGIIRWASDVSLYALSPASSDYDAEDTSYPDDPIRSFDDAFCACDPRVISTVRYTIRLRDHWRYSSNDWTFLATGIPLTLPVPSPKHWGELPYFDSGIPG